MIRLSVFLCAGIFLVLLIAGQDHGQVRQGLLAVPDVPAETVAVAAEPKLALHVPETVATSAVFVPAQPVRVAPAAPAEPEVTVAAAPAEPAAPQPALPSPDVWAYVDARSVNVRAGPSTSDPVIGRLANGEAVVVVPQVNPVEGWSRVRIEGDGIEGYVAERFLTAQEP